MVLTKIVEAFIQFGIWLFLKIVPKEPADRYERMNSMTSDPDPLDDLIISGEQALRYRLAEYLRRMPDDLKPLFQREFQRRPKEEDKSRQKEETKQ